MPKARRAIEEAVASQDVVIEVLDARMPLASENPDISEIRGQKPCLRLLTKSDLADPSVTQAWIRYFDSNVRGGPSITLAISQQNLGEVRSKIPAACQRLAPHRTGPNKRLRTMVVGIPNVGKSTLINTLMNRKVAKVGDEPAVTKGQQKVILANGMLVSDNPGILWPKIDDEHAALRLALGGAMSDNAIEYEVVALFGIRIFMKRYPSLLLARYKLRELPAHASLVLDEIGRRRGCLRSGGVVDLHKAADVFIHDFRTGALGPSTLEVPPRSP